MAQEGSRGVLASGRRRRREHGLEALVDGAFVHRCAQRRGEHKADVLHDDKPYVCLCHSTLARFLVGQGEHTVHVWIKGASVPPAIPAYEGEVKRSGSAHKGLGDLVDQVVVVTWAEKPA